MARQQHRVIIQALACSGDVNVGYVDYTDEIITIADHLKSIKGCGDSNHFWSAVPHDSLHAQYQRHMGGNDISYNGDGDGTGAVHLGTANVHVQPDGC